MDNSLGSGFMAVFAVSGSVVLLAMQVHKRLLSDFMKKMEHEIKKPITGSVPKKKVRFADDVMGSTADQRAWSKKYMATPAPASSRPNNDENLEGLPENWQAMYKGMILQNRNLRGYH